MPIRINLKELFNSDSQEITIDKLNFNFNKVLELGVGKVGPIGPKGPKGSAGPKGLTGDKGDRGNNWFIGSGSPVSQTFTGISELDFYIDTVNGSIWQYSGGSWSQLVNFSSVVSGYLSSLGALFERGLGTGSSVDTKFIRFVNRGNNLSDITNDVVGGSSNNDILFLDNFNENAGLINVINFPANPDDLYTSLQRIYVDNSTGVPGRFHLDFGTIHPDTLGNFLFTDIKHNFKLGHFVENVTGGGATYPNTNTYIYTSKLNASISDLAPLSDIDFNSIFELKTAKYNNEAPFPNPPFKGNLVTRFGSREALGEFSSHILADGISFTLQSYVSNLGIAYNYSSANTILNGGNFFMMDGNASMSGMLLNLRTYINQDTDIFAVLNVGDRSASDATINVGANRTANGAAQLDLIGDTSNTNYGTRLRRNSGVNGITELLHLGTGALELNTVNSADINFKIGGTSRATVNSSGIDINGNVRLSNTSSNNTVLANGVRFYSTDNSNWSAINPYQGSSNSLIGIQFSTSNGSGPVDRVRILPDGRVGIGTGSPTALLQITEGGGSVRMGDINGSGNPVVELQDGAGTVVQLEASGNNLLFNAGGSERMRLTSAGNFGIGLSPTYKLDINGQGRFGPGTVVSGPPTSRRPGVMLSGGQLSALGGGDHNGLLMGNATTLSLIVNNGIAMQYLVDHTGAIDSYNSSANQFRLISGSVTSPGIVFGSSPATGFYRPTSNQIGVSINGLARIIIRDTYTVFGDDVTQGRGLINHLPSTSAFPAFTFKGNETSGLWGEVSTSNVGLSRGGSPKLILDASNNHTALFFASNVGVPQSASSSTDLFKSGTTDVTNLSIGSAVYAISMYWTRVGRVVTVHFNLFRTGGSGSANLTTYNFPKPLSTLTAGSVGIATYYNSPSVDSSARIQDGTSGPDYWCIIRSDTSNASTVGNASGSFTYVV